MFLRENVLCPYVQPIFFLYATNLLIFYLYDRLACNLLYMFNMIFKGVGSMKKVFYLVMISSITSIFLLSPSVASANWRDMSPPSAAHRDSQRAECGGMGTAGNPHWTGQGDTSYHQMQQARASLGQGPLGDAMRKNAHNNITRMLPRQRLWIAGIPTPFTRFKHNK